VIRAVLDTNVFVSAFLLRGRLNAVVELVMQERFIWLLSEGILEEYARVAARPLYGLSPTELHTLLFQVKERAEWVRVTSQLVVVTADPSDDQFLACAVDGRADWIATGDRHLLALRTFRGVRIGSPAEFLRTLPAR
jgi:putative PIN family toxin of toxin-antitoxin system